MEHSGIMGRVVYYTYLSSNFCHPPEPVLNNLTGYAKNTLLHCPAFTNNFKNTYIIKAPIDYELTLSEEKIFSNSQDQDFFNRWVVVRDVKEGVCSLKLPRILFFSADSIELEVKAASHHPNGFTENSTIIESRYDIGRHFRPLETAFMFGNTKKVSIQAGEALHYVKLHTTEKIKLVPFHYTAEIKNLNDGKFETRRATRAKPLSYWYDIHAKFYRKRLLKLIKESLL